MILSLFQGANYRICSVPVVCAFASTTGYFLAAFQAASRASINVHSATIDKCVFAHHSPKLMARFDKARRPPRPT